jgi:predicted MFS family arabinose efflux permease
VSRKINPQIVQNSASITSEQVALMALGTGSIVANIYYIQPLLSLIASTFGLSATNAGIIAMLSQLGTALGILCFVPLGDTKERRSLIVRLLLAACVSLLAMATARSLWWLVVASFGIGLTAATVHVIVPYAANLAPEAQRGRIIGTVMSGLLLGILLARTVSGLLAAWFGWRLPYLVSALLMLTIAGLYRLRLPRSEPAANLTWPDLIRSTGKLIRTQPALVESSLIGASFFGAFSAFWTTLVFFLREPPYHYGSGVAGLFGLVGAVGAAAAPIVGRRADRHGVRSNITISLIIAVLAFVVLWFYGNHMVGLIIGVILLDCGVQAGHVSNQTRIYGLLPEARSRLNMVYMICYFTAGAIGSYTGTFSWQHFGWNGVCALGGLMILLGAAVHTFTSLFTYNSSRRSQFSKHSRTVDCADCRRVS